MVKSRRCGGMSLWAIFFLNPSCIPPFYASYLSWSEQLFSTTQSHSHDVLCRAKWPQIEFSETVSQNKSFLLQVVSVRYLVTMYLTKTVTLCLQQPMFQQLAGGEQQLPFQMGSLSPQLSPAMQLPSPTAAWVVAPHLEWKKLMRTIWYLVPCQLGSL
jgi:hypothetical protein